MAGTADPGSPVKRKELMQILLDVTDDRGRFLAIHSAGLSFAFILLYSF
jgi:hypothetical protein